MCYSRESSLKTTTLSLIAIVYLLSSNDPHYKWLAFTLLGWCLMQFAELLLWTTDPRKGCTDFNRLVTMTLVPFVLMLQPLGSLFGSLYIIPWAKSTDFRKTFIVLYSILVILAVSYFYYYKPYKRCTTVTKGGHLDWSTSNPDLPDNLINVVLYFIWGLMISLPLFMFWNKNISIIMVLILILAFGFSHGLNTDSRASIWCHYTTHTSAIASAFLLLKQTKIYDVLNC
jgi:hypothetical protein